METLAGEIAEAEAEYDAGGCEVKSPEELMQEILSRGESSSDLRA
jgi:hypothetical protein